MQHALTGTLADGDETHVLAGYRVPADTHLEVRFAPTTNQSTGREPIWLMVRATVEPGATWLLAVDTLAGPRDVDLRLPPDAVLRWPPDAQVIALDAADYARLAALADQLERSYEALDRVHADPRSGIPDLARRLFRVESAWVGLPGVLRVWAEHQRRLSTQDLVLLEESARDLEQTVTTLRQHVRGGVSETVRAVIQDQSGQLLLESGWLRDLCRRLSQRDPQ